MSLSRRTLENLYRAYARKEFIHPDPIEFVYRADPPDREIVGLAAALLAYGRVGQILKSVENVLDRLKSPATVQTASLSELRRCFSGFKHRFTVGDEVAGLLFGAGRIIRQSGSLGQFVASHISSSDKTVLKAMTALTDALVDGSNGLCRGLVSDPRKGSACKRLNLYFRWMVRKDDVDPGGWPISPAKLIVPLDTHMHRFALTEGLTTRKAADMKTALQITAEFRKLSPEDPIKYDFALTRLGILKTAGYEVG
jgi:uncharacterized protein (TIGR02757 family)